MTAAVLVAAMSCNKIQTAPLAPVQDGVRSVRVNPVLQLSTKASIAPSEAESFINDIQYYVVADGEVVAYKKVDGFAPAIFELELSSHQSWSFHIQVNHPESASPRVLSSQYRMSDYAEGAMLMASALGGTAYSEAEIDSRTMTGDVYLPVYIDLVRFDIRSITLEPLDPAQIGNPSFTGGFQPQNFKVLRVFLADVADDSAESAWLNEGGLSTAASSWKSLLDTEVNEPLSASAPISFTPARSLYLKHFSSRTSGGVTTYTKTKLVVEAEYDQNGIHYHCYYPFGFTSSLRTRNVYPVDIKITRHGYQDIEGTVFPTHIAPLMGQWNLQDSAVQVVF